MFATPAGKPATKKAFAGSAVIAGTVFREPGFAVRGVEVTLAAVGEPGGGAKLKKLKTTSDARGEFVFRVPAGRQNYEVSVAFKGLKPHTKTVSVDGEERVDVTFMLDAESNK